jgi:outer membrane lipase/esterase
MSMTISKDIDAIAKTPRAGKPDRRCGGHHAGRFTKVNVRSRSQASGAAVSTRAAALTAAILASALGSAQANAATFDQMYVFGDSTVDSGWWSGALNGQCGAVAAPCTTGNPNKDQLIRNAIANGGTGAPVGVGQMNSQIIAAHFGLIALPANQPGGTNYAISGSLSAAVNGSGNLNPNPNLPATVNQIQTYLSVSAGAPDQQALYLVSSGGNDITYATDNFTTLSAREGFLATQAAALASQLQVLQSAGAQNLVVYGEQSRGTLPTFWTNTLFHDLQTDGVHFTGINVAALIATIQANPTQYGFTSATVMPGVLGTGTGSACVDLASSGTGWGQWCANTTNPNGTKYAYLASANSEQTSLFSDDQHLSAAGQLLEADFVIGQIDTPLPAALPLFAAGVGVLAAVGRRRKRQAQAAAAA